MDYYSFNRPRRDGRLSRPCWLTQLTDSGRFTHKEVTRPAASLAQDRESTPAEPAVLTTMPSHQHKDCRTVDTPWSNLGLTGHRQDVWCPFWLPLPAVWSSHMMISYDDVVSLKIRASIQSTLHDGTEYRNQRLRALSLSSLPLVGHA